MSPMLTVFVALTFIAIAIQAGVLVALYLAVKKTSARAEALMDRAQPVIENAGALIQETAPKLREITTNLLETTSMVRAQVDRMDSTMTEVVDRSRLQLLRIDELVSRTLDKIEMTTAILETVTMSPVKRVTGLMQALSTGLSTYLGKRRRAAGANGDDEEMFI